MKKKNFYLHFLAFLCCIATGLSAQTGKTVTGKVTDTQGEELPDVSVAIKGAGTGTVTGLDGTFSLQVAPSAVLDGTFSLQVAPSAVLEFTYIGFKSQTVTVGNRPVIDIVMEETSQNLDEVVVVAVGYGDVRRRDLTGSIAKADIKEINKVPVMNIAESLGGRVAGVQVSSSDGGLSDNFDVVIRGAGSLTQSTAPLYVVDGFPQESSSMSALNPNDIESIDFLKDASATAIYGSRGANGVVIITTKKGKAGKPSVTYNGSMSVGVVRNTMEMMNGYEFAALQQELMSPEDFEKYYLQNGKTLESYKTMPWYDWQDQIFRTAVSHSHHVLLSGQQADLRYSASLSYNNQQGVIINSDLSRYQGRINLSQKVNKRLQVDLTANYASNVQNGPTASGATTSLSTAYMYSVWAYRPVSPSGADSRWSKTNMYTGAREFVNRTGEKHRFLPIPAKELAVNTKLEQNAYWR